MPKPSALSRRTFCGTIAAAGAAAQSPQTAKPNIVFILTDDQGWWDLHCHGNPDIETPNLDKLAAESVEFTRFYVSPVCAPTRASLMTGRHYLRTGIYNTRFGGDTMRLDEATLPQALHGAGYRTGMFGKWHLGRYKPGDPMHRGFDTALWFAEGHLERYYYSDQLLFDGRPVETRGYITNLLTDRAISFIDSSRNRPFFLYLPYNVPHEPRIVEDRYIEKYLKKGLPLSEATVYGMVTHCDEQIGRLLAHLDSAGLRDNTIVLFMSDNGGVSRHFNAGLRGRKGSAYEGGVRSPLFIRWPGKVPAGAKVDAMAAHIDILPTLCELTGTPLPQGQPLDGRSLASLVRTGKGESPHRYLCHIWDRYRPSLQSNWSISDGRFKLVKQELFDLQTDPGESHDIAKEHPEKTAKLHAEFTRWLAEVTKGRSFEPPPIEIGADADSVEVQASWALIDGTHVTMSPPGWRITPGSDKLGKPEPGSSINYTFAGYDWDTIDGWRKPGERARWRIRVAQPGTYEVTMSYGCEPANTGGRFRLKLGNAHLDGKVEPTGGRDIFERRRLGTLSLSSGEAWLSVEVVQSGGHELMALNRIWFQRL